VDSINGGVGWSRRRFLHLAGGAAAAVGFGAALPSPPYVSAAETRDLTILAFNENPFGMFPAAREAVLATVDSGNRYPKETEEALRADIGRSLGVPSEQILLGAGSIEPLAIASQALCSAGRGPVVPLPTFEAVVKYAGLRGYDSVQVPLTAAHQIDLDAMLARAPGSDLLFVCNPNNPTGVIVDRDDMHAFLDRVPAGTHVLVDEAYHEWVDSPRYESCVRYVREGRPLTVLRTFSKVYGLAGLRVGYAVSSPEIVERLSPHRLQNSLNTAGIAAARASLAEQAEVAKVRARNARIRADYTAWLETRGLPVLPSQTNFVMADLGRPVPPVIEALKERGFLVGRLFPSMPTHLRVSLGTEEQMARFQVAFADVLG
jgi:histidinol-phosphate aminotransferase